MQRPVDRQFYAIDANNGNRSHFQTPTSTDRETLVTNVANSVIGRDKIFSGPFGQRKVVYLDYIASGRALSFIEDYIRREVLPEYGNTHTTTSLTSLQTTLFRHEARDIIRNAVNASEHDSVIFTGSGTTGAVHKLIHALNLKEPPVVFVGPYEHHSNLLPWKDLGAQVVTIRQTEVGIVDLSHLEEELKKWQGSKQQLIGSFSAASNVTGILCDVDAITVVLHRYNALAFWDYATAAPYVHLDMNPVVTGKDAGLVYKDAMFLSPHKFIGGVNTPGVLVAKKRLFHNDIPHDGGGGSVFFVRRECHRYLREPELREEGGTPDIVGAIRAGLVFQLKSALTADLIMDRERQMFRRASEAWKSVDNLILLGNMVADRLPVFSFLIYHPHTGLFLHHNFVSALLNDLFGIQARGGCACAGPYAMEVLGLSEEKATQIENLLAEDRRLDRVHLRRYTEYSHREVLRPGFTRLNLPYILTEDEVTFVLQAVTLVAEHGWKLLPQYMFNPETGEWRHKQQQVFKERKWLGHISYASGCMQYSLPKVTPKGPLPQSFQECLDTARQVFMKAVKSVPKTSDQSVMFDEDARPYRWFLLPSEAAHVLSSSHTHPPRSPSSLPFCPPHLLQRLCEVHKMAAVHSEIENAGSDVGAKTENADSNVNVNRCVIDGEKDGWRADERSNIGTNVKKHGTSADIKACAIDADAVKDKAFGCVLKSVVSTDQCDINLSTSPTTTVSQSLKETFVKDRYSTADPHSNSQINQKGKTSNSDNLTDTSKGEPDRTFVKTVQTALERGYGDSDSGLSAVFSQEIETTTITHPHNPQGMEASSRLPQSFSQTAEVFKGNREGSLGFSHTPSDVIEEKMPQQSNLSWTPEIKSTQTEKTMPAAVELSSVCTESSDKTSEKTMSGEIDSPPKSSDNTQSSISKSRKKKSKKKGGGQCVENGVCELQTCAKPQKREPPSGNHWVSPSKDIFKPAVKALEEFSMIRDGDRVLVCLSGGKDSLSLLHSMRQYQFYCRGKGIQFDLGAVTVDPQTPSYDPSPLKDVLADLGVPYFFESQCIMDTAVNLPYECASICSFCSRMKRGRIYAAARRENYNVLALGQHLDDLAESFIMSLFHNGSLRTMKAHYTVQEGDLRVIRPFVYVREKDLRHFAEKNHLPVIAENCPACFEAPKERHRTKQLLASQEILFPRLYASILSAIRPVMAVSRTGVSAADLLSAQQTHDDADI